MDKVDRMQAKALRLCCGIMRSLAAVDVDIKLKIYWASLTGYRDFHPDEKHLNWERERARRSCFEWDDEITNRFYTSYSSLQILRTDIQQNTALHQ